MKSNIVTNKNVISLPAPLLNDTAIKETITCIRSHRERIFNVSKEIHGHQAIFHNYGHGGAGWTFLFGCVQKSIQQFEEYITKERATSKNPTIHIIGAGCYGLLTAILLARKNYQVTIYAKEIEQLTSTKAVGFFFPRPRKCSTEQERNLFLQMGIASYKTYLDIARGSHPFISKGPRLVDAYFSPLIDPGYQPYIDLKLIEQPKQATIAFQTEHTQQYDAMVYRVIYINPSLIYAELHKEATRLGIPIKTAEVTSLNQVDAPVAFNCAGLGAAQLAHDPRVLPVQGHLITLQHQTPCDYLINFMVPQEATRRDQFGQPYTFMKNELIYFAPKDAGILGITFIRNEGSLTTNMHEFDRLLERARHFFGRS